MSDSLKNIKGFLNKKFVTAMETKILEDIDYLNLGIPSMNYVISGKPYSGGLPLSGKMSVIYGPEAAGKTSIILNAISQAQKQNIDVVYIDTERNILKSRFEQFDIDIDDLIYATPETVEEAFDIMENVCNLRMVNSYDEPALIIWDSIAGTPTLKELSRKIDDVEIASQAGVLTRCLKRLRGKVQKSNVGVVFINQARANQDQYGDIFNLPGGYALKQNCDIIIRCNKTKPDVNGQGVKISTPGKNRFFSPFQSTTVLFDYKKGWTKENIIDSFVELLKETGLVEKSGGWFHLNSDYSKLLNEGLDAKEAVKKVKKYQNKEFVEKLLNDDEYYKQLLIDTEKYIEQNRLQVTNSLKDTNLEKNAEIADSQESIVKIKEKYDTEE